MKVSISHKVSFQRRALKGSLWLLGCMSFMVSCSQNGIFNVKLQTTVLPQFEVQNLVINTSENTPVTFSISSPTIPQSVVGVGYTITSSGQSQKGGVVVASSSSPNQFIYRPPQNYIGTDSFSYEVLAKNNTDGFGTVVINIESSIYTLTPSLALRGAGCTMCHAQVTSNMITDFGYTPPAPDSSSSDLGYFFGGDFPGGNSSYASDPIYPLENTIYGDDFTGSAQETAWNSAHITGTVYVPNATIPLSYFENPITSQGNVFPNLRESLTIEGYLNYAFSNQIPNLNVAPGSTPFTQMPTPQISVAQSIYIGAPTLGQILALAPELTQSPGFQFFPQNQASSQFQGLSVAPSGNYLTNEASPTMICEGDIVVNGVLFLNNLNLQTGPTGCRIYATQSVFIQGPITYVGTKTLTPTLQISSAVAILMGIGPAAPGDGYYADNSAKYRFAPPSEGGIFDNFTWETRETGLTTQQKLTRIYNQSLMIPNLQDASQYSSTRQLSYEHLLLNAPQIHSRYVGSFTGVIIGEVGLISINTFTFNFDSNFQTVAILPLLDESTYLSVVQ